MADYFLDSSALVKRYRREDGTDYILSLLDAGHRLVAARLAEVEVASAIIRRGRNSGISYDSLSSVLAELSGEMQRTFEIIELTGAALTRAIDLIQAHALRSADAIQLSCALLARRQQGAEFILVSADLELNSAAAAEGLKVIDPTNL